MNYNRPLQYVLFAMYQESIKHHKFLKLDADNLQDAIKESELYCHAKDQLLLDNYGNQYPLRSNRILLNYVPKDRCVTQFHPRSCRWCSFKAGNTGRCSH